MEVRLNTLNIGDVVVLENMFFKVDSIEKTSRNNGCKVIFTNEVGDKRMKYSENPNEKINIK